MHSPTLVSWTLFVAAILAVACGPEPAPPGPAGETPPTVVIAPGGLPGTETKPPNKADELVDADTFACGFERCNLGGEYCRTLYAVSEGPCEYPHSLFVHPNDGHWQRQACGLRTCEPLPSDGGCPAPHALECNGCFVHEDGAVYDYPDACF